MRYCFLPVGPESRHKARWGISLDPGLCLKNKKRILSVCSVRSGVCVEVGKSCEIGYNLALRGINPPKQAGVAAFLFPQV